MITFLTHKEIDFYKWDQCIERSVNELVYAYSWYLNTVCKEWDALVENDYESVFPLPTRKKAFIRYAYQPFFIQQLGIFSSTPLFVDRVQAFLSAIPKKYKFVEINLNAQNPFDYQRFGGWKNVNLILDLQKEYDFIASSYSSNTARNLQEASSKQLRIVENVDPQEIIELFKTDRGQHIKSYKTTDYITLLELLKLLIQNEMAVSFGTYNSQNNLCAGAVFIKQKKRFIFVFSGNSLEGKNTKAMFYLIDHFIRQHANTDSILDFEGSNNEGLARFYSSFGAKKSNYYTYQLNRLNFPINLIFSIYRKYK